MKLAASVTMMSGTPDTVVIRPVSVDSAVVISTTARPRARQAARLLSSIHIADRQLANTIFAPTDRSIPPEMTITLWAIARKASDIEPAVIVRTAKPLTSGICEKRHATRTTSSTATPTVQPCRRGQPGELARRLRQRRDDPVEGGHAHGVPPQVAGHFPPHSPDEAVGGGQQGVLAGVRGQLGDDAATVEHGGAVAHEADLAQLAGEHQHGGALVGERADEVVHLVLGSDVDAARRVEQQHHAQATGEPAGDRHLLLVAAGQPAHLARRPGVDRQSADRLVDPRPFLGGTDRSPLGDAVEQRRGDVLADRTLRQEGVQAVGGHEHDAAADDVEWDAGRALAGRR